VRRVFFWLTLAGLVCPAFSSSAEDVSPRIGDIEIYGAHKVSLKKIRAVLGVTEGSPLPASKGQLEEKLEKISGVVASRVEAACCLNGKTILYVGIEERGAHHIEFRPEPAGDVTLPSELTETYGHFLDSVDQSIRLAEQEENLSAGYSLMRNPGARAAQERFVELAAKYLPALHEAVRTARDPEQRAMAAYILQYGPRGPRTSQQLVNDVQYALRDVDDHVRANAIRALSAMYVGAKVHPDQGITIQPTWFVELLNSVVWSDRRNAASALVDMTESRDPETLALIRDRALPALVEMARWRDLTHALPAFILVGRLADLPEKQIQDDWVNSDHEAVIKLALKKKHSS
jgi:hypothetical protein